MTASEGASILLDTTVLVDLQTELRQKREGPARGFLAAQTEAMAHVAFVTWMEFAEGFGDNDRLACEAFLGVFRVLWPDSETAWRAARVSRALRASGNPIGDHDLWIAALALQHGMPVASRNERHFGRVAGLPLLAY
jgi:predicted nucleic acid-binding protein